jgi:histidine ammonia-lyase
MAFHHLGTATMDIDEVESLLTQQIDLDDNAIALIQKCRQFLDEKMKDETKVYYGINTGFGSLCNVKISKEDINQLQENLVLSHACGLGDEVPTDIVKIMLLLKIKNFTYGHSGVSIELTQRLIEFYNFYR